MCLSRGCIDSYERHSDGCITMADLTAAAADAKIDIPALIANLSAGAGLTGATGAVQPDLAPHEMHAVTMEPSLGADPGDASDSDDPLRAKPGGGDLHPRPQPAIWMA